MEFIRSAGRIIRIKYTDKEQRALDESVSEAVRKAALGHEKEEMAIVAWVLFRRLGWRENGIRGFLKDFFPILRELNTYYQIDANDGPWLCSKKLKENGIDFDKIFDEVME